MKSNVVINTRTGVKTNITESIIGDPSDHSDKFIIKNLDDYDFPGKESFYTFCRKYNLYKTLNRSSKLVTWRINNSIRKTKNKKSKKTAALSVHKLSNKDIHYPILGDGTPSSTTDTSWVSGNLRNKEKTFSSVIMDNRKTIPNVVTPLRYSHTFSEMYPKLSFENYINTLMNTTDMYIYSKTRACLRKHYPTEYSLFRSNNDFMLSNFQFQGFSNNTKFVGTALLDKIKFLLEVYSDKARVILGGIYLVGSNIYNHLVALLREVFDNIFKFISRLIFNIVHHTFTNWDKISPFVIDIIILYITSWLFNSELPLSYAIALYAGFHTIQVTCSSDYKIKSLCSIVSDYIDTIFENHCNSDCSGSESSTYYPPDSTEFLPQSDVKPLKPTWNESTRSRKIHRAKIRNSMNLALNADMIFNSDIAISMARLFSNSVARAFLPDWFKVRCDELFGKIHVNENVGIVQFCCDLTNCAVTIMESYMDYLTTWDPKTIFSSPCNDFITETNPIILYRDLIEPTKISSSSDIPEIRVPLMEAYEVVTNFIQDGQLIEESMKNYKTHLPFERRMHDLRQLWKELGYGILKENRKTPLGLVITGSPGVGKSHFLEMVKIMFSKYKGIKKYNPNISYARDINANFWDGYDPITNKIIHYSEIGSSRIPNSRTSGLAEVLSLVDSLPMTANMSKVEDKGKVPLIPEMVVIDTNIENLGADETMRNPSAVLRRFLYVKLEPRALDPATNTMSQASVQAFKENEYSQRGNYHTQHDLWNITLYRIVPMSNADRNTITLYEGTSMHKVREILRSEWDRCSQEFSFRHRELHENDESGLFNDYTPQNSINVLDDFDLLPSSDFKSCLDIMLQLNNASPYCSEYVRDYINDLLYDLAKLSYYYIGDDFWTLYYDEYLHIEPHRVFHHYIREYSSDLSTYFCRHLNSHFKYHCYRRKEEWPQDNIMVYHTKDSYNSLFRDINDRKDLLFSVANSYVKFSRPSDSKGYDLNFLSELCNLSFSYPYYALCSIYTLILISIEGYVQYPNRFSRYVPNVTKHFYESHNNRKLTPILMLGAIIGILGVGSIWNIYNKSKYTPQTNLSRSVASDDTLVKEHVSSPPKRDKINVEDEYCIPTIRTVKTTYNNNRMFDYETCSNFMRRNMRVILLKSSVDSNIHKAYVMGIKSEYCIVNTHSIRSAKYVAFTGLTPPKFDPLDVNFTFHPINPFKIAELRSDMTILRHPVNRFQDVLEYVPCRDELKAPFRDDAGDRIYYRNIPITVGDYIMDSFYSYSDDNHYVGKCGTPVIGKSCNQHFLLGIHAAGSDDNPEAICTAFVREDIEHALGKVTSYVSQGFNEFIEDLSPIIHYRDPIKHESPSHIDILGRDLLARRVSYKDSKLRPAFDGLSNILSCEDTITLPHFNRIKPNIIHSNGDINQSLSEYYINTLRLDDDDVYLAPWNQFIRKLDVRKKIYFSGNVESVITLLVDRFSTIPIDKPWNLDSAVNGNENDYYCKSLNFSTSSGFRLGGDKLSHFNVLGNGKKSPKVHLKSDISDILSKYSNLHTTQCPYGLHLKDEPVTIDKFVNGKIRVFAMTDLALLIVQRMYLGPFYTCMQSHRDLFCCKIGINMHGVESNSMYIELNAENTFLFEGDYSGYDTSMPLYISKMVTKIIVGVCSNTYSREALDILSSMLSDIEEPVLNMNGTYIRVPGYQPSGKYGTAEDNSLRGLILLLLGFQILCTPEGHGHEANMTEKYSINDFFRLVKPYIYGDDVLCRVSNELRPFFNGNTYSNVVKVEFGMKFTDPSNKDLPSKLSIVPMDCTFLKRKFVYNSTLGRYIGVLENNSLLKMGKYYMYNKCVDSDEQKAQILNSMLLEICASDKRLLFEKVFTLLQEQLIHSYDCFTWEKCLSILSNDVDNSDFQFEFSHDYPLLSNDFHFQNEPMDDEQVDNVNQKSDDMNESDLPAKTFSGPDLQTNMKVTNDTQHMIKSLEQWRPVSASTLTLPIVIAPMWEWFKNSYVNSILTSRRRFKCDLEIRFTWSSDYTADGYYSVCPIRYASTVPYNMEDCVITNPESFEIWRNACNSVVYKVPYLNPVPSFNMVWDSDGRDKNMMRYITLIINHLAGSEFKFYVDVRAVNITLGPSIYHFQSESPDVIANRNVHVLEQSVVEDPPEMTDIVSFADIAAIPTRYPKKNMTGANAVGMDFAETPRGAQNFAIGVFQAWKGTMCFRFDFVAPMNARATFEIGLIDRPDVPNGRPTGLLQTFTFNMVDHKSIIVRVPFNGDQSYYRSRSTILGYRLHNPGVRIYKLYGQDVNIDIINYRWIEDFQGYNPKSSTSLEFKEDLQSQLYDNKANLMKTFVSQSSFKRNWKHMVDYASRVSQFVSKTVTFEVVGMALVGDYVNAIEHYLDNVAEYIGREHRVAQLIVDKSTATTSTILKIPRVMSEIKDVLGTSSRTLKSVASASRQETVLSRLLLYSLFHRGSMRWTLSGLEGTQVPVGVTDDADRDYNFELDDNGHFGEAGMKIMEGFGNIVKFEIKDKSPMFCRFNNIKTFDHQIYNYVTTDQRASIDISNVPNNRRISINVSTSPDFELINFFWFPFRTFGGDQTESGIGMSKAFDTSFAFIQKNLDIMESVRAVGITTNLIRSASLDPTTSNIVSDRMGLEVSTALPVEQEVTGPLAKLVREVSKITAYVGDYELQDIDFECFTTLYKKELVIRTSQIHSFLAAANRIYVANAFVIRYFGSITQYFLNINMSDYVNQPNNKFLLLQYFIVCMTTRMLSRFVKIHSLSNDTDWTLKYEELMVIHSVPNIEGIGNVKYIPPKGAIKSSYKYIIDMFMGGRDYDIIRGYLFTYLLDAPDKNATDSYLSQSMISTPVVSKALYEAFAVSTINHDSTRQVFEKFITKRNYETEIVCGFFVKGKTPLKSEWTL